MERCRHVMPSSSAAPTSSQCTRGFRSPTLPHDLVSVASPGALCLHSATSQSILFAFLSAASAAAAAAAAWDCACYFASGSTRCLHCTSLNFVLLYRLRLYLRRNNNNDDIKRKSMPTLVVSTDLRPSRSKPCAL